MKVDLDQEDLIRLVMGITPKCKAMENPTILKVGNLSFESGFLEKWEWDKYELQKLDEEFLIYIYLTCKHSWKEYNETN